MGKSNITKYNLQMQLWGTLYDHSPAVNEEKDMLINI